MQTKLLIRGWLLLVLIGVGVIAPQSSQAQDAQAQPDQITIDGLAVKLPFQPGAEWQVTAGWEAANHQQAWNYYAIDVVPVNQACLGRPILAVAHGFIESNNGHELQIDHRVNNYRSLYAHLDTVSPGLAVGTEVFQGQQIGTCGGYPNFAPHLHFQIFQGARVANSGVIPVPIDGITDANRLRSGQRGLYSTNQLPNLAPNPPSLLEPSHTSAINRLNPTLRWQDMGDPDNYPNPHRDYTVEIWKTDQSWSQSWGWTTNTDWQPTLPNEGSYAWRVLSGDGSVGSDWSPTWNFIADTTMPNGGYTHPANDSATRQSVDLRGTASDNLSGVKHVNFTAHYDGEWHVIHTDSTAPYEYTWDLSGISDQLILLGYDIYDQAGNVALAPQGVLTMYKDTVNPTGGYTQPANDVVVQDSLVLRGTASDNLSGVKHVNFTAHYDGEWHVIHTDTTAPYEYTWDLSEISDQLILLGYDIYDHAGNFALAPQGVLTIHKVSQYQQFLPLAQR